VLFAVLFAVLAVASMLPLASQTAQAQGSAKASLPTPALDTSLAASSMFDVGELSLLASDADKPLFLRYGVAANAHFTAFDAAFSTVRGIGTCCPEVFGTQPLETVLRQPHLSLAVLAEVPLVWRVGLGVRAGYTLWGADFVKADNVPVFNAAGRERQAAIEHVFRAAIHTVTLEPTLTLRPLDALTLAFGVQLGLMPAPTFSYVERIASSDSISRFVLPDGRRSLERNAASGALPRSASLLENLQLALLAGISYEIPLNRTGTLLLAPELWYQQSLRSLSADVLRPDSTLGTWTYQALRAGIALKWSPYRTIRPELTPELQEKVRQLRQYDSLIRLERQRNQEHLKQVDSANRAIAKRLEELKKVGLTVNIRSVSGISASGSVVQKPSLVVEELRSVLVKTLSNVVVFDAGSAQIPSWYHRVQSADRAQFALSSLADKPVREVQGHLLNIVGKRLQDYPQAVLLLSAAAADGELAERRMAAVSDYLRDVWKIPEKRLVQRAPNVLSSANAAKAGSQAEQVELSSTLPELLAPLVLDGVRRVAEPSIIDIGLEMSAGAGLKQWSLEATQFVENESVTLREWSGGKEHPATLRWNLATEPASLPQSGQDVSVQLSITDANNKTADAPIVTLPVEQRSLAQKEARGQQSGKIVLADVVGFTAAATPNEQASATLQRLLEVLGVPVARAKQIIVRYATDAGIRHAEATLNALGVSVRDRNVVLQKADALLGGAEAAHVVQVEVLMP
jgi:hypothetical protein